MFFQDIFFILCHDYGWSLDNFHIIWNLSDVVVAPLKCTTFTRSKSLEKMCTNCFPICYQFIIFYRFFIIFFSIFLKISPTFRFFYRIFRIFISFFDKLYEIFRVIYPSMVMTYFETHYTFLWQRNTKSFAKFWIIITVGPISRREDFIYPSILERTLWRI